MTQLQHDPLTRGASISRAPWRNILNRRGGGRKKTERPEGGVYSLATFDCSFLKKKKKTEIVVAVVAQYYDTDVNKEYAIRGNSAILKCVVPSFVADFVKVLSWHTDQGEEFVPGDDYGRSSLASSIFFRRRAREQIVFDFSKKRKKCNRCTREYTGLVNVHLTPARYFSREGEAWWPK